MDAGLIEDEIGIECIFERNWGFEISGDVWFEDDLMLAFEIEF